MPLQYDVVIIGGGVVGLACAAESATMGYSTLLVEKHGSFGQETSSRNSEVIHSGIYYPTAFVKARLCVSANHSIYKECERSGVWTNMCGKLIVAVNPGEESALQDLHHQGQENGIEGMRFLDSRQAAKIEPHIKCHAAIYLPSTGIIDSHGLMKSYLAEAKAGSADMAFGVEFKNGGWSKGSFKLNLRDASGEATQIESRYVVNSAGLHSDLVAENFGIDIDRAGYRLHHNRGHYYTVSARKSRLISHLVYPLPHEHLVSVGIHITIDRAGQAKLGPDMEYINSLVPEPQWYVFDDSRKEKFYNAVKSYFPDLSMEDLSPGQVGVRPKLLGSETKVKDFIISEESGKGLPGLVNLVGIESPGLTCAREISREVFKLIKD